MQLISTYSGLPAFETLLIAVILILKYVLDSNHDIGHLLLSANPAKILIH